MLPPPADIRPTSKLDYTEPEWVIDQPDATIEISLRAVGADSLALATSVALWGRGFSTADDAEAAGQIRQARLMAAFAAVKLGADFGMRAAHGGFTEYALTQAGSESGSRVLNDIHGLMVFEDDPAPMFLKLGPVAASVSPSLDRLKAAMSAAIRTEGLSEDRQVTYDLFAPSFGQTSADARFALLMAALESMIEPAPRSSSSARHVELLIQMTKEADLPPSEVQSILGTLRFLKDESIGQAGRKLAATLGDREYYGLPAEQFFTKAYTIRSRLLHGLRPIPGRWEVGQWAGHAEVFVADLLSMTTLTAAES